MKTAHALIFFRIGATNALPTGSERRFAQCSVIVLDALLFPERDQDRTISRTLERMVLRQALNLSGLQKKRCSVSKNQAKKPNIS
jgi:hypothetical protein